MRLIDLGIQVEAFIESDLGRYLIDRSNAEQKAALEALGGVDPDDPKAIRHLAATRPPKQDSCEGLERLSDLLLPAARPSDQSQAYAEEYELVRLRHCADCPNAASGPPIRPWREVPIVRIVKRHTAVRIWANIISYRLDIFRSIYCHRSNYLNIPICHTA
jgi:hypothetical protein